MRGDRPFTLSPLFDRTKYAAKGSAGGMAGGYGRISTSTGEVLETKGVREFEPGTRIVIELPGGGGFYAAHTRDPRAVRQDVLDGLVSIAAAREFYGVALDPRTFEIDQAATETLRSQ